MAAVITRGHAVVRDLQNAALVSARFKELPAAGCRNFACVTHAKKTCAAAENVENQAAVVVVGDLVICGVPMHVGGVEHIDRRVAKVVLQTNVGVDKVCLGVGLFAKLVESFLACLAAANSTDILICGKLIKEIENVYLIGIKGSKVVEYAVVVAVTVGKDPSFDNELTILVLCNVELCKRAVNVCGTLVVVVATVNDDRVTVCKLKDVAQTDHGVVYRFTSFNTNLHHGYGAGAGGGILLQNGKLTCGCCFPSDAHFFLFVEPVNGYKFLALGQKENVELCTRYRIHVKACISLFPECVQNIVNCLNLCKNGFLAIKGRLKYLCGLQGCNDLGRHLFGWICGIVEIRNFRNLDNRGIRCGHLGWCSHLGRGVLKRCAIGRCSIGNRLFVTGCKHTQKHNNCQKQCKKSFHFDSFLSENFPF